LFIVVVTLGDQAMKFLRLKQVIELTGLKRSAIYARAASGKFPRFFKLGVGAHASGFRADDIAAWMESCAAVGQAPKGPMA
jgi:prophage regulatory protein